MRLNSLIVPCVLVALLLPPGGILVTRGAPPGPGEGGKKSSPPEVTVARPTSREVTDYQDFTGRIEAAQSVDLRARVSGYLDKVLFKDGSEVKKGDTLFVIDPRPYQIALDQAMANLKLAEAQRELTKRTLERAKAAGAAVGQAEIDMAEAAYRNAVSQLEAAKPALDVAKLNLDWTTVRSPIDGRIGRRLVDRGNLVKADETHLATLVSVDPVYVYFDVDERTVLRLERLARDGKAKSLREAALPVDVGLDGETGFPRRGTLSFVDNRVNPDTGTLAMRADLTNADQSLRPGQFARVRLPIGGPHKALLVPDEAILSDQGKKIVYVVNAENKVVSRAVTIGAKRDSLRVIEEGLRPDDRVITQGQARLRPGDTVNPK